MARLEKFAERMDRSLDEVNRGKKEKKGRDDYGFQSRLGRKMARRLRRGSNNGRVNPIESASWLAASYNVPTFHRVNGRPVRPRSWRFYRNRFPANEGYLTPARPDTGTE